jgi:serine protease Do
MSDLSFFSGLILLALSAPSACAHTGSARKSDAGATDTVAPKTAPAPVLASAALSAPSATGSFAPVVKLVMPSVVSISSTRVVKAPPQMLPFDDPFFRRFFGPEFNAPHEFKQHGLGSGVTLKGDLVVTNNHVVDGADEIKITTFDKREFKAEVVGTDSQSDLAVLRLEGNPTGLTPMEFGDSSHLELGDVVLAVGYPFGVGETVTMGIVSGLGRSNLGIEQYENFIQTDAAINPGNSGGALVDSGGHLIGINTAILSQSGGYMGIGFAIPSEMAKPIVNALLLHGKVVRGYLGVSIQDITPELATALKLPSASGVLVSGVSADTPAAKAGLLRGDVILKINGEQMTSSGQLRNLIAASGANAKATLEIWRAGKSLTVAVELGELPASLGAEKPNAPQSEGAPGSVSGLTLQPLNSDLRSQYDIPASVASGLVITGVQPDSTAGMAGLRPGDVALEVNQKKVATVDQFKTEWKKSPGKVLLLVQRGAATTFLVVGK